MDTDHHTVIASETYGEQVYGRGSNVILSQSEDGIYYVAWSDGALNRHDTLAAAYADLRDGCENWADSDVDEDEAAFWAARANKYAELAR